MQGIEGISSTGHLNQAGSVIAEICPEFAQNG
jgi:hypothetical protein